MSNYPASLDTDATLYVARDYIQTKLAAPQAAGDNVAIVTNPTGWAVNMVLSIDVGKNTVEQQLVTNVAGNILTVTRGFAGTVASAHAAGAVVSCNVDAIYQSSAKSAILAIETALGPNLENVLSGPAPAYPALLARSYDFIPQTPGGTLGIGANSVTLTPVPLGVNANDGSHYLYIDNGVGAAEAVLIIGGGTAVSGASSGTVIVTCANNHSGAWQIRSATAGFQEATQIIKTAGTPGAISNPPGVYTTYAPWNLLGMSNISLDLYGVTLAPSWVAGVTTSVLISSAIVVGTPSTVTANINFPGRELSVAASVALTSAAGLSPGDFVILQGSENGRAFYQIVRIKTLASAVLTPYEEIRIPIQTSDVGVAKVTLATGVVVRGLTIDGAGVSGAGGANISAPMNFSGLGPGCLFADLTLKNFVLGSNSAGLFTTYAINCTYRNIVCMSCGGGGGALFYHWFHSDCTFDSMIGRDGGSFGFEPVYGVGLKVSNVCIHGLNGRAVKIQACAWCDFVNIDGSDCETGVYVMGGSYHIKIQNVTGNHNVGGPGFGVGTSQEDNRSVLFDGVSALGNGDADLIVGSGDYDITFRNILTLASTVQTAGTKTRFDWLDQIVAAVAVAGAVTANSRYVSTTTEALTTAAGAAYQLIVNTTRATNYTGPPMMGVVTVSNGTNTQGIPVLGRVQANNGYFIIEVRNLHATQAFNGTLLITLSLDVTG